MRFKLNPLAPNGFTIVQDHTTVVAGGSSSSTTGGATTLAELTDVDSTVASPSDGDIIVYRSAGSDWVLEAKPAGGSNPALNDVTDVTISTVADNEVLAYDNGTSTWTNQTAAEAGLAAASHTHTASEVTDFDTEVSNNTDVAANTAARHSAVTVTDSSEIDFTLTGQNITASLIAGSIDETKLNTSTNASLDLADSATQPGDNISTLTNDSGFITDITGGDLSDLADTTITTIASGELLKWNGTAWVNNTLAEAGISAVGHTHTASNITDFDTEVSNNTDVAANTAARHTAVTVTDSAEIDFSLTGQDITASLKAGSIDETKLDTSTNASLDLADSSVQPGDNISTLTNDSGYTTNTGDVVGPASATNNAIARFDTTTGKLIQNSIVTVSDTGDITTTGNYSTSTGTITTGAGLSTNTISEWLAGSGVTVDGVLIKDGEVDGVDVSALETTVSGKQDILAEGAFVDGDKTKLDGIETGADVTDTANVTAAGALMDSEVDADLKTLSLPANTTISTFGASLVDDADAATARTTLGVDAAGTDNSTDVTLAGTPDYITIAGQVITRNAIDLTTDVTSTLPVANGGTGASTLTGVLKGNGTSAISAAVAGTDYTTPSSTETVTNKSISGSSNTITNIGTSAISDDAVTAAKMQYGVVRGRRGGTSGDANWYSSGTTNTDTSAKGAYFQAGRTATSSGADTTVTFPNAYTYTPIVIATTSSAGGANSFAIVTATTTTTFTCRCINDAGSRVAENINWLAIGQ